MAGTGLTPPTRVALRSVAGDERALSQWGEVQRLKQHWGSLFWPQRLGVEKVVIFALEPSVSIARRQRARPRQTAAAPGNPPASWGPAAGLAVSCCTLPVLRLLRFTERGSAAGGSPLKMRWGGPRLHHHPTPGTVGCPSSRGQDKG